MADTSGDGLDGPDPLPLPDDRRVPVVPPSAGGRHVNQVHVAAYPRRRVAMRVVALGEPEALESWCRRAAVGDALVGGFFVTPVGTPLGELWVGGLRAPSVPFDPPSGPRPLVRGGRRAPGAASTAAARLPAAPRGDLLQAGPLLVRGGRAAVRDGDDPEGFSAGQRAVRLGHLRRPPPARRPGHHPPPAAGGGLRRPRRRRGRPHAGRAGVADGGAGRAAAPSTSTAAARPPWSRAARCATRRARPRASRSPAAGLSRRRSRSRPRAASAGAAPPPPRRSRPPGARSPGHAKRRRATTRARWRPAGARSPGSAAASTSADASAASSPGGTSQPARAGEAGSASMNEGGAPASPAIGGHAHGHRLDVDEAEALARRRDGEDVGRRERPRQLRRGRASRRGTPRSPHGDAAATSAGCSPSHSPGAPPHSTSGSGRPSSSRARAWARTSVGISLDPGEAADEQHHRRGRVGQRRELLAARSATAPGRTVGGRPAARVVAEPPEPGGDPLARPRRAGPSNSPRSTPFGTTSTASAGRSSAAVASMRAGSDATSTRAERAAQRRIRSAHARAVVPRRARRRWPSSISSSVPCRWVTTGRSGRRRGERLVHRRQVVEVGHLDVVEHPRAPPGCAATRATRCSDASSPSAGHDAVGRPGPVLVGRVEGRRGAHAGRARPGAAS